ncbi:exo-alpha-sialidase [Niabella terrae]
MCLKIFRSALWLLIIGGFACGSQQRLSKNETSPAHRNGILLEEFLYQQADFPSCHSASLIELDNGELLCTYFGGTHERHPDVEIRLSRKTKEGKWLPPVSVADGVQSAEKRYPTWNPVLFQPKDGPLYLYYKVGPSPAAWWGEYKTSTDNGHSWLAATKFEGPLLGPVKNKPIQLGDGTILSGSSREDSGWQAHVERSTDNGKTWQFIGPLNDGKQLRAIQPTLLRYPDGRIQMLSRTSNKGQEWIAETWSDDKGLHWSEMGFTSLPNNNSGIDAVTLKDGRQLLIYNHSTREQEGMGHKGRGVINLAVSRDGKHWEAALVLDYLDEPEKQFSYPAIMQTADGLVHIVYTWNRKRIKHVVIDPDKLVTYPIVNGKWPADKIPLIPSKDS